MGSFKELNIKEEFYFQWHITEKCNLRCKHCYHDSYSSTNELSIDELFLIADKIEEASLKWGKKATISITGGEPFVVKDKIYPLLHYLEQLSSVYHFDILTNGWLINNEEINKLKSLRKLRRIQLSLEGSTPSINDLIRGSGSFEKTLAAIRLLKENEIQVSVMMTISNINKDEIEPLIDLLEKERVDTFAAERFIPEGRGADFEKAFLSPSQIKVVYNRIYTRAMKQKKPRILLYRPLFALLNGNDPTVGAMCSAGTNAMTIMHDGTIFPCRRLPISIGNALEDSFYKVWYTSEVLWDIRNPKNIKGKCFECDLLAVCRGCRALAYKISGDYLSEDPQCWK